MPAPIEINAPQRRVAREALPPSRSHRATPVVYRTHAVSSCREVYPEGNGASPNLTKGDNHRGFITATME
jgi:hypothetical protein